MKYVGTYSDPKDLVTKEKLEAVASRVSTNEDNIAMAESDIDGLQTDVGTLKTNVGNIQTALTSKQDTVVGGASTITEDNLTASRALVSNSSGKVTVSDITSTELGYLDDVTSNVQTQLDSKQPTITVNGIVQGDGAGNLSAAETVNANLLDLNPAAVGLGNVDNVKQYSATNPPPYPVTSVNGATGEVKGTFYVTVTPTGSGYAATADKTAVEVYAAYAAGYAVYAVVKFESVAAPFELPLVAAASTSGTIILGFGALGALNPTKNPQYPTVSYTGTVWMAWLGTLAKESDIPTELPNPHSLNIKIGDTTTSYDGSAPKTVEIPNGVPAVTTADNGKILRVVNGAWAAVELLNAGGVSF